MTKLQKVNELTGTLEDVYPNLIIVGGKNIAVPVDKQHVVKNMGAEIGDTIWIKYDGRGYLQEAVLEQRGKKEETKPRTLTEDMWVDSSSQIGKGYLAVESAKVPPAPESVKEYVSLRDRLIILQSNAKLCADMYAITNLTTVQPEDFDSAMDLIWARAIKDLGIVIKAAGGSSS